MPFTSKRQWRAAYAGKIPGVDPHEWAHETKDFKKLPDRAPAEKGEPTLRSKKSDFTSVGTAPFEKGRGAMQSKAAEFKRLSPAEAKAQRKASWEKGTTGAAIGGALLPVAGSALGAGLTGKKENRGRRAAGAAAGSLLGLVPGAVLHHRGLSRGSGLQAALGRGLALGGTVAGSAAGNDLVDKYTRGKKAESDEEITRRSNLITGLAGAVPLGGTGTIAAALTGHKHNRGRRALGAMGGGFLGANLGRIGGLPGAMIGKGLGAAGGNRLVDDLTKHERQRGKKAAEEKPVNPEVEKLRRTGTLSAGGWGLVPLPGTGAAGAYYSGHKHNRGRRALGAAVGGLIGAGTIPLIGKGLGAGAGNELVDYVTRHERSQKKAAAAEFAQLEDELAQVFKVAALGFAGY